MKISPDDPRRPRCARGAGRVATAAIAGLALSAPGCGSDVPPLPPPRKPVAQAAPAPKVKARGRQKVKDEDTSHHLRRKALDAASAP